MRLGLIEIDELVCDESRERAFKLDHSGIGARRLLNELVSGM